MTRLSAQLGLHVVVEGVETQEQLELLTGDNSIDEVQGYLLGRPMPASDIRRLLYSSCVAPADTASWVCTPSTRRGVRLKSCRNFVFSRKFTLFLSETCIGVTELLTMLHGPTAG
jgi:hypothetical protein